MLPLFKRSPFKRGVTRSFFGLACSNGRCCCGFWGVYLLGLLLPRRWCIARPLAARFEQRVRSCWSAAGRLGIGCLPPVCFDCLAHRSCLIGAKLL